MKTVNKGRKLMLLIMLLSTLALYVQSCKKADPLRPPAANTLPILPATPGIKLVGSGAIGNANQGSSVAISADGNTLTFSGPNDNNGTGVIWIFNRTNNAWNQVAKLVGSDAAGSPGQRSVAISADGNTVIVGGPRDNLGKGAAWIFTLNNGIWAQQGSKLVGTGAIGNAYQGSSVSISSDGNTAVIGGYFDNGVIDQSGFGFNEAVGATWIFTRNNGIWTQQGSKLVGRGAVGFAFQGSSVSISGDGNTVITGGNADNNFIGAAWIFTRSGGIWAQQGSKLIGTGAIGSATQGSSVSISSDGNTVVIGSNNDDNNCAFPDCNPIGAAWIFTRNNGIWAQQGSKLVGSGALEASQGYSVSISGDGNFLVMGGSTDNNGIGAAWIFKQNNGMWTQQGSKLFGSGAVGNPYQGSSVSINSDGTTVAVGGPGDNGNQGAVWIFNR